MKYAKHRLLSVLFLLLVLSSFGQKKIVILGSSSAAGAGANPTDSSWARRLQFSFRRNLADNIDTTIVNLGYPGFVSYQTMPTNYPLPANRTGWPPDPIRNVTAALAEQPDVVIINLPSNDANLPDYQKKETMDNFRFMFRQFSNAGIRCFISTTQPRSDMNPTQRLQLRELYDSVLNNFGVYAIDFWTDLVSNDGQYMIRAAVNADNIHPNNLGHSLMFARVQAKNLFTVALPLPISLKEFRATRSVQGVLLHWESAGEEPGSTYDLQRSSDGTRFESIHQVSVTANRSSSVHEWTDPRPLSGKSYYRLKISENGKTNYSPVRMVTVQGGLSFLDLKIRPTEVEALLRVEKEGTGQVRVIDVQGMEVRNLTCTLRKPSTTVRIATADLKPGAYYLKVSGAGQETVRSFGILR